MNLGRETETLEFKKSTSELREGVISIGAILNKHQKGELYFGVKPDGTPIGQDISEKTLREISQAIANHIEPQVFPEISAVSLDGRDCICVRFEGTETPYFAYSVARIRVADEDKVMSPQELERFILEKNNADSAWEAEVSDVSLDRVEDAKVRDYVERGQAAGRIGFTYTDKRSALDKLGLLSGDFLLNAGVVLFCENATNDLQMAIFAGTERLTFLDIQRQHGSVFDLVSEAEQYIFKNIRWRVQFGSMQRKEIPEIPVDAVREALINSFCHKAYGTGQSNEVAIYKDRIEIYNPGSFPAGYSPEDFISGKERPIRRNPLIAQTLYYSKDVESFGTGLKRIADACESAGCRYAFETLKSGFVVVFYREDSADLVVAPQDNTQVNPQDELAEKILSFCVSPKTKKEIAEHYGYKDAKSFSARYLKPLLESGQLKMTLPDKPNSKNQKYMKA